MLQHSEACCEKTQPSELRNQKTEAVMQEEAVMLTTPSLEINSPIPWPTTSVGLRVVWLAEPGVPQLVSGFCGRPSGQEEICCEESSAPGTATSPGLPCAHTAHHELSVEGLWFHTMAAGVS